METTIVYWDNWLWNFHVPVAGKAAVVALISYSLVLRPLPCRCCSPCIAASITIAHPSIQMMVIVALVSFLLSYPCEVRMILVAFDVPIGIMQASSFQV